MITSKSIEEAMTIKRDVTVLFAAGGFQLHKWAENDIRILTEDDELPDELIALEKRPKTEIFHHTLQSKT